nr:AmmeMemoRadiSam system protein B [Ardenticatena sp.]
MRVADIRQSPIAGTWYPGDPFTLRATVRRLLDEAEPPPVPTPPLGFIVPHAGLAYSGPTAAYAYKLLEGRSVERVFVLGPSHFAYVGDAATTAERMWETPLGRVPLAVETLAALAEHFPLNATRGDREHSIEMQLPFLQVVLGHFELVPLMLSAHTVAACRHLANALVRVFNPATDILLASSDLNHLNDYRLVEERDAEFAQALEAFDIARVATLALDPETTVCGRFPILTVLFVAEALGTTNLTVLHQTHSGQVTGMLVPGQYTVGYLAAAIHE